MVHVNEEHNQSKNCNSSHFDIWQNGDNYLSSVIGDMGIVDVTTHSLSINDMVHSVVDWVHVSQVDIILRIDY